MEPLKIGQKLYKKTKTDLKELTIKSIGKKYFYVVESPYLRDKIRIEDLCFEDYNFCQNNYKLYVSKEEIDDEIEASAIYSEIRKNYFDTYSTPREILTLDKLRQILKIIKGEL